MQASIFFLIASVAFLAETHGRNIIESDFNIFAIPPFIISRHCSLLNKSASTKQIQEIVRRKTEPLLGLSRALLSRGFSDFDTYEKSGFIVIETLEKYCKNDHPSWGNNTVEWMEAVKPCFQDNIYDNIILDQERINSSLNAACDDQSNAWEKMGRIVWRNGATNPNVSGLTFINSVGIYAECYNHKKIEFADQIMQIVDEKFQPVAKLFEAFYLMMRNFNDKSRVKSFQSNLQEYCIKFNSSFKNDVNAALKALGLCFGKRVIEFTLVANNIGWALEYACQNQDKVYESLMNEGREWGIWSNDWIVCANITFYNEKTPCEYIHDHWKVFKCARTFFLNSQKPGRAELTDYIHQKLSKMLPCDGITNIELLP